VFCQLLIKLSAIDYILDCSIRVSQDEGEIVMNNSYTNSFHLQVKPEQVTKLAACIVGDSTESSDLYNGIQIGEEHYVFYKCIPNKYIHGRKSTEEAGIFIMKTRKAVLFGTYSRGIQYENCCSVLDKLAEYLIQSNL